MKSTQLAHDSHNSSGARYPICFLANDMDTPTNVGTLFRIADALGVEKIFLTGKSVVPPNSKIKKTSRSTEKYVDYEYHLNSKELVQSLKSLNYRIVCLEITNTSIDIDAYKAGKNEKLCLVLGSEKHGVSDELLSASDTVVHIPMLGSNSSMNVASACAIATYELRKQLCICDA